jgi:hypothetical protein
MESILTSIKKLLGIEEDYVQFDSDIIMGINSAIMALGQLGVELAAGFMISDKTAKWTDLIGDRKDIEGVKQYILLKTKLVFDPPSNSFLIDAINKQISELEWRINIQVDPLIEPVVSTTTEGGSTGV